MPYAQIGDTRLYYTRDGDPSLPALVLTHSLGTNAGLWARQIPALSQHFHVIRYDTRGHGLSSVPDGDYSFAALADDLTGLLDHLNIQLASLCGTSMGGMTVMQAALNRPQLVDRIILCNTAARIGSAQGWTDRINLVGDQGLDSLAPTLVTRWVSDDFRATQPGGVQMLCDMLRRTPDRGYMANCAALRDGDLRTRIAAIAAQALVISGDTDLAATTAQAIDLTHALTHARHVELKAAHTSNWEQPDAFNTLVLNFLTGKAA